MNRRKVVERTNTPLLDCCTNNTQILTTEQNQESNENNIQLYTFKNRRKRRRRVDCHEASPKHNREDNSMTFQTVLYDQRGLKKQKFFNYSREEEGKTIDRNIPCLQMNHQKLNLHAIQRQRKHSNVIVVQEVDQPPKRPCLPHVVDDFMNQLHWPTLEPLMKNAYWLRSSLPPSIPPFIIHRLFEGFCQRVSPATLYRQIPPMYHKCIIHMYQQALLFAFNT